MSKSDFDILWEFIGDAYKDMPAARVRAAGEALQRVQTGDREHNYADMGDNEFSIRIYLEPDDEYPFVDLNYGIDEDGDLMFWWYTHPEGGLDNREHIGFVPENDSHCRKCGVHWDDHYLSDCSHTKKDNWQLRGLDL